MAQALEGAQDAQEAPAPAITPLLPMAEKREIARQVSSEPQLGQAIGASASAIDRRASKRVSHSWQQYS